MKMMSPRLPLKLVGRDAVQSGQIDAVFADSVRGSDLYVRDTALAPSKVSIRKPTRWPASRISSVVNPRILRSESSSAARRNAVVFPTPGGPVRRSA